MQSGVSGASNAVRSLASRIRRAPLVYRGITVAYVFLRILAILGTPVVGTFPDSATYRQSPGQLAYPFVSFTGHAMRPWVAPLLYAILPTDTFRSDAQVLISILAWLTLAGSVALALRDRRLRVISFAVILALSCVTAVTNWDRLILAESTSISFAVLALAAWIRFAQKRSVLTAVAVVLSTTLWSFTKSGMFPIVGLAALIVLVSLIKTRERKMLGAVAAALLVVSVWGYAANARSDKVYEQYDQQGLSQFNINFANMLRLEILEHPSETAWFVAHGMPNPVGLHPYERTSPFDDDFTTSFPAFIATYTARPDFVAWGNTKAQHVYAEYVLTHPSSVVAQFSRELPDLLVAPRMSAVYETGPRDVLPSAVQALLFETTTDPTTGSVPPTTFGDVGLLAGAIVVLAIAAPRRVRARGLLLTAGIAAGLSLIALAVGWMLSPVELARHAIPASVLIRVSLWVVLFALVDGLLAGERSPRRLTSSDPYG